MQTNPFNSVFEYNTFENNVLVKEISISQSLPDLIIQSLASSLTQNETSAFLTITTIVENIGSGVTHELGWSDRALLVTSSFRYVLASMQRTEALSPGDTYVLTLVAAVPELYSGDMELRVEIDFFDIVREEDNDNNVEVEDIEIPVILPDLTVNDISLDLSSLEGGDEIVVSWTSQNTGNRLISNKVWKDAIYIENQEGRFKIGVAMVRHLLKKWAYI